jgi:hypothetical protein
MADCFFHTRGLRTLEIPGEGGGEFGVKLSSNPGVVSKGNPVILAFPGRGFCVIWKFQGCKFQGWGFFSYKIIVLSPLWEKSAIIKYDT